MKSKLMTRVFFTNVSMYSSNYHKSNSFSSSNVNHSLNKPVNHNVQGFGNGPKSSP